MDFSSCSVLIFRSGDIVCLSLLITCVSVTLAALLQIDLVRVKKAVFKGNRAVVSGGAIFADKSSTSFTANEYNHSLAENRFGFCFATFGNEARPIFAPSNVSLVRVSECEIVSGRMGGSEGCVRRAGEGEIVEACQKAWGGQ